MLSIRSVAAGVGAVIALYIAVFLYQLIASYRPNVATGLGALQGNALEVLLYPAFWVAAIAVFLAGAFWARE
ncbi:MAG: hypothetical protein ACRD2Y_02565 [Terriglobales bacterium]